MDFMIFFENVMIIWSYKDYIGCQNIWYGSYVDV